MARARARGGQVFLVAVVLLHAACAATPAAALRTSAISAAPEYPHPRQPGDRHAAAVALPPALSPDIMPLLPSPGADGDAAPPSDVVPTIPSSPSPPNPDALLPDSAPAPFGSAPAVAAQSTTPPPPLARVAWSLAAGLLSMWLV
ncbi:hypothetical protein GUJ93_ZPchr0001g31043 [Zizania palustris]|uniref:Uncharacterized protein n=1 Tax=Zizania palustris TaxID=103762 RepID=A0A8J5R8P5_ZIZPA|nr:hypothetical protein GUJ93_ZPchr0001g31043 [Zizania palustris]